MKSFLPALSLAALSWPAVAGVVIDQGSEGRSFALAYVGPQQFAEQSFRPALARSVGAATYLTPGYGGRSTTNLSLAIWSGTVADPSATLLAAGTAVGVGNGDWIDVSWDPVTLEKGREYFLRISTFGTDTSGQFTVIGGSNPYAGGIFYNAGVAYPAYDAAFRTFAVAGVPEPQVWLAMFAGLGLVGCALRSRRSTSREPARV